MLLTFDLDGRQVVARCPAVALARAGLVLMLPVRVLVAATRFAVIVGVTVGVGDGGIAAAGQAKVTPAATEQGVNPEANCGDGNDDETHL